MARASAKKGKASKGRTPSRGAEKKPADNAAEDPHQKMCSTPKRNSGASPFDGLKFGMVSARTHAAPAAFPSSLR